MDRPSIPPTRKMLPGATKTPVKYKHGKKQSLIKTTPLIKTMSLFEYNPDEGKADDNATS